jgi:ribose transport system substrate-binding protein
MRKRTHRRSMLLVALVALSLALAACSSSGSSGTSPGSSPSSSSGTSSSSPASSASTSAAMTLAKERVAEFSKPPSATLPVTTSVKAPKNLTIAFTWCAQVVCTSIASGIQQAAQALGAKFEAFHHDDTASTVSAAFDNAIATNPSMVLTSGDPQQWYQSQLNELAAKKIPVVAWSLPSAYHSPGIAANIISNDDYFFEGVLEADYVAVQSNDSGTFLLESAPQYPVLATQSAGFMYEISRVCPSCTIVTDNFSVDQLASGANVAATVNTLQKNPNTSWLVATCGCLITQQLATAVKSAGFTNLKAIEADGTAANYQLIVTHQLVVADIALAEQYLGWLAVNDGLVAASGKTVPTYTSPAYTTIPGHPDIQVSGLPIQILTAADISNPNTVYDPIPGYQKQFEKLWGLG